jgi:hypothetical protein
LKSNCFLDSFMSFDTVRHLFPSGFASVVRGGCVYVGAV